MQAQCPHYMVKADGSDGAVMYDTLQAFCRPGFLTEQAITLGDVIDATKKQLDTMPESVVKPTLDSLTKIQKELFQTSAKAVAVAQFGASVSVSEEDKQDLKDKEAEIAELITKLKAKAAGGGVASVKEMGKTSSALAVQVD